VVLSMSACLSWSDVVRVMGLNQCIPKGVEVVCSRLGIT